MDEMAQHAGQVPQREAEDRAPKGTSRRKGELASRGKEVMVKEVLPMEHVGLVEECEGSRMGGIMARGAVVQRRWVEKW